MKILDDVGQYLDMIIYKYDYEKTLTLNTQNTGSMSDNIVSIDKYQNYLKNDSFAEYNFMNEIQKRMDDPKYNKNKTPNLSVEVPFSEMNEILLIKLNCERVLYKFVNIVKDLVDCKLIHEKIIMEGLNGFLQIENDDLILYSVHRIMARDGKSALYPGKLILLTPFRRKT